MNGALLTIGFSLLFALQSLSQNFPFVEKQIPFPREKIKDWVDFDMDGDLDLVNFENGKLVCFENREGFYGRNEIPLSKNFIRYVLKDLDNNGNPELLLINKDGIQCYKQWVKRLKEDHKFSFTSSGSQIRDAVFTDIDKNHQTDLVIMESISSIDSISLSVVFNFGAPNQNTVVVEKSIYAVVANLHTASNGDFFAVYVNYSTSDENGDLLKAYKYDTASSFKKKDIYIEGRLMRVIDFNKDGTNDFFFHNNRGESYDFINGKDYSKVHLGNTNLWTDIDSLYVIDLNNDSFPEVCFFAYRALYVCPNLGGKTLDQRIKVFDRYRSVSQTSYEYAEYFFRDADQDGRMDILSSNHRQIILYNKGNFNFSPAPLMGMEREITGARQIADYDMDGDWDFVCTGDSGKIVWYENNGLEDYKMNEIYLPGYNFTVEYYPKFPIDIDQDGDNDLLYGKDNTLYWDENNGTGMFPQHILDSEIELGYKFKSGYQYVKDLDNDGDDDIIVTGQRGGIYLYENLSKLKYSKTQLKAASSSVYIDFGLSVADYNNDGFMDVLAREYSTSKLEKSVIEFYEMKGTKPIVFGKTTDEVQFDGGSSYLDKHADIDNDGDLDLFTGSYKYLSFSKVLENLTINSYSKVTLSTFWDKNEDGVKQNDEPVLLAVGNINLDRYANHIINTDSVQTYLVRDTGTFSATLQGIDTALMKITNGTEKEITIKELGSNVDIQFGVASSHSKSNINSTLTGVSSRCGTEVPYWLNIENRALKYENVEFLFKPDPAMKFIGSNPPPDASSGDGYIYRINQLGPFKTYRIKMNVMMPIPKTAEPPSVKSRITKYIEVTKDTFQVTRDTLVQVVRCSYDPNDKESLTGYTDSGYISQSQPWLEYLIRFQNTGNDTAYDVKISDQLPSSLDIESLDIRASSHPVIAELDNPSNQVVFKFNNIYLVDSGKNYTNSMGFVRFRVNISKGIKKDHMQRITNQASIFFDQNYPIITNKAINKFYNCLLDSLVFFDTISSPNLMEGKIRGDMIDSIEWSVNGQKIVPANRDFVYTLNDTGHYKFSVTFGNIMCGYKTFYKNIRSGNLAYQPLTKSQVQIFPNPTFDKVKISNADGNATRLLIYNCQGSKVEEFEIKERQQEFELQHLPAGVYILRLLSSHSESGVFKLVKY